MGNDGQACQARAADSDPCLSAGEPDIGAAALRGSRVLPSIHQQELNGYAARIPQQLTITQRGCTNDQIVAIMNNQSSAFHSVQAVEKSIRGKIVYVYKEILACRYSCLYHVCADRGVEVSFWGGRKYGLRITVRNMSAFKSRQIRTRLADSE